MTRMSLIALTLMLVGLPLALSAQEQLSPPQQGYTFQGTNLRWFGLSTPDNNQAHAVCRAECAKDSQCRGYSLVLKGAFNPNDLPVCYLMANVGQTVPHACCIIGMKQGITSATSLLGTWQWQCCVASGNMRKGPLQITGQNPDGNFVGWLEESDGRYRTKVQGRIQGSQVVFDRVEIPQRWTGVLVQGANGVLQMQGTWTGTSQESFSDRSFTIVRTGP